MFFPNDEELRNLKRIYDACWIRVTPKGVRRYNLLTNRHVKFDLDGRVLRSLIAKGWLWLETDSPFEHTPVLFTAEGMLAMEPDIAKRMDEVYIHIKMLTNRILLEEAFLFAEPDDEDGCMTNFGTWKNKTYREALNKRLKGWL